MRFKIERRDGTIIYANDICMTGGFLQSVGIWANDEEIDRMNLSDILWIWVLDPVHDILIFV